MPTRHPAHPTLFVFDHPLIQRKLTEARDKRTSHQDFRRLLNEIAGLMTFAASRHLPTTTVDVDTPLETTAGVALERPFTLVPILRAGIGMTDGILALVPEARVAHVGVYRDEATLKPVAYYFKVPPDMSESDVLIVDPMLATGGSASHAISEIKRVGARSVRLLCLVAAPEGVAKLAADHPDVEIFAASLDRELNELGYILPGLGDAGDRIFGTQ